MKICKVQGCNKTSKSRGWCPTHYWRWWYYGSPLKTKNNKNPVTWEFLLSCSVTNKKTGCIEWQRGQKCGYGAVFVNGRQEAAHRVSYRLNIGPIPRCLFVCHRCDNRPCINPEHLFLGTAKDNNVDAANKGRTARGEKNSRAKLTEKDVLAIREMSGSQAQIAKTFGVSQSNIFYIKSRRSWRHIA